MGRVAALVKYYMNGLFPRMASWMKIEQTREIIYNAPSPKTITVANKLKREINAP